MQSKPALLFVILLFLVLFSCNKSENNIPHQSISLNPVTDISETGFTVNWEMGTTEVKSALLELSNSNDFTTILKSIAVSNLASESQSVSGLSGATPYFFRLTFLLGDGQSIITETKKIYTSYESEFVKFTTSDGINLAAKIKYLKSNNEKGPAIICMHEFGAFVNNWDNNDLVTDFIAEGYVCMILDFRGHGQSDEFDLQLIANDLSLVTPDLVAAIEYIKNFPSTDSMRIALMGGSLGAIMSVAGNGYDEVKCSVALSGARIGIYSLFPEMELKSAFFIAGELDANDQVDFSEEAEKLYEIAIEPKKLKIISGTSAHGTELLGSKGVMEEIKDWVDNALLK